MTASPDPSRPESVKGPTLGAGESPAASDVRVLVRQLARQLKEANAALEAIRTDYARATELMQAIRDAQDGIALTDPEGNFVFMNTAHADLFGWRADDLIGQSWRVLYGPEERLRLEVEIMPRLFEAGQWRGEVMGQSREGLPVLQEVTLTTMPSGGILCSTRDISQRNAQEARRRDLEERLRLLERQEAVARMAQAVTHDFNNLLAAISGYAMLLEADLKPDSHKKGWAGKILKATDQATEVLSILRGGAKPPSLSADNELVCDPVQVLLAALDIAEPFRPEGVIVVQEHPGQGPLTRVDRKCLSRALLNLIKNAFEAMPQGGTLRVGWTSADACEEAPFPSGEPVVQLGSRTGEFAGVLTVSDTGRGFALDWLDQAGAERFSTKGTADGHGFGLDSLKELAAQPGVQVTIRSGHGRGTCVGVSLPGSSMTGRRVAHQPVCEPSRILVVDDNRSVGALMCGMIERLGHRTRLVTDPREAVTILRQNPSAFDLLLTDYDMPWIRGDRLAAKVNRLRANLPVILYSGETEFLDPQCSFAAVLTKPVQLVALAHALSQALAADNAAT